MRRSFLKQALVVFATCALFVPIALDYGVTAQAAQLTFSDPNCSTFGLTQNPDGSYTLACTGGGGGGGGGGAFSCLPIAASPSSSTTVGTAVKLTASCSGGTGSPNYAWASSGGPAGCPAIGANGSPQTLNSPAAALAGCAYTLTATDNATPAAQIQKPINVTWSAAGAAISCLGAPTDNVGTTITGQTLTIGLTWPPDGVQLSYLTSDYGTFSPTGAVVLTFTTSGVANSIAGGRSGLIKGVEYQTAPAGRNGSLSTQPCDFLGTNAVPLTGLGCGKASFTNATGPSEGFTQGSTKAKCAAQLAPNTTYYFNISNNKNNCNGVACSMLFYFNKADGT